MPRFTPRFPPKGEDPIADAVRERRGPEGLNDLDSALLNAPKITIGYNGLFRAIRTQNSLPGDIRELLILRVAARNYAAFEWMHHEHVGRDDGLNTQQLAIIRDLVEPIPSLKNIPSNYPLNRLQLAALAFADASTLQVRVPDRVFRDLKDALTEQTSPGSSVEQQIMECTATVMGYNGVSRILVALDVGDHRHDMVGLPGITCRDQVIKASDGVGLFVCTYTKEDEPGRPYILFANSLLTNMSMWEIVVSNLSRKYNIILFDQRGHGKSSIPQEPATLDRLSDDIADIISTLKLTVPIHAIIGVSQGGATALNVAARHARLASNFVVCDTQAKSPAGSEATWNQRIEYARQNGMEGLADITVPRWFPEPSEYSVPSGRCYGHVHDMIERTKLEGLIIGSAALGNYEIPTEKLAESFDKRKSRKMLLIAGEKDGVIPDILSKLNNDLCKSADSQFQIIPGSGHLPMLQNPVSWTNIVTKFLA